MYSVCHACSVISVFWFERKPDKELVYCAASEIENPAQTRPAVQARSSGGRRLRERWRRWTGGRDERAKKGVIQEIAPVSDGVHETTLFLIFSLIAKELMFVTGRLGGQEYLQYKLSM